jgi:hypothetical protein
VQAPATDIANVDQLLALADELMYQEKKASPVRGWRSDQV